MCPVIASFGNLSVLAHICNKYLNLNVHFGLLSTNCKDLCCDFYFPFHLQGTLTYTIPYFCLQDTGESKFSGTVYTFW